MIPEGGRWKIEGGERVEEQVRIQYHLYTVYQGPAKQH